MEWTHSPKTGRLPRAAWSHQRRGTRATGARRAQELPPLVRRPACRMLVAQVTHFFAVMLWVAAALSVLAGLPPLAGAQLGTLMPTSVRVRRDGAPVTIAKSYGIKVDESMLTGGKRPQTCRGRRFGVRRDVHRREGRHRRSAHGNQCPGRPVVRRWRHRGPRTGGSIADRPPLSGSRRPADGRSKRVGEAARVRGDTRPPRSSAPTRQGP